MPSCELCGSDKGEEYKPTSVPEFGRAMEIAVAQVPHACECVCRKCKDNLKKYGEKKIVMNEKRHKAYKKEACAGRNMVYAGNVVGKSMSVRLAWSMRDVTRQHTHAPIVGTNRSLHDQDNFRWVKPAQIRADLRGAGRRVPDRGICPKWISHRRRP